jgi:hypothetical protein
VNFGIFLAARIIAGLQYPFRVDPAGRTVPSGTRATLKPRARQTGKFMSNAYVESQMKVVGKCNAGWGVCGFTTSMYSMYDKNPAARPWLINAPRAFTVLSEIKGYLRLLQEFGGEKLIKDIEEFTRTFGPPYDKFKIGWYIDYINKAGLKYVNQVTGEEDLSILKDKMFGIALPPECVADYLKRRCGISSATTTADPGGDVFIGVKDISVDNTTKPYSGLCHWVYRKGTTIYSWGNSYASLTAADKDFQAVYFIKIG